MNSVIRLTVQFPLPLSHNRLYCSSRPSCVCTTAISRACPYSLSILSIPRSRILLLCTFPILLSPLTTFEFPSLGDCEALYQIFALHANCELEFGHVTVYACFGVFKGDTQEIEVKLRLQIARDTCLLLDIFLTRTPLILKPLIKAQPIDVLCPPFPPACEEDLFWVLWEVGLVEAAYEVLGS